MEPGREEAPNRAQPHGHEGPDPTAGTPLSPCSPERLQEKSNPLEACFAVALWLHCQIEIGNEGTGEKAKPTKKKKKEEQSCW